MTELELIKKENQELKARLDRLEGIDKDCIPTYSFSKITDTELKQLVKIKQSLNHNIFDNWFNFSLNFDDETINFFTHLIEKNILFIKKYNEEDLKVKFIIPLLNRIDFFSFKEEFRDFYELPLKYATEKFIFQGTTDFVVSKGLFESEKPYFFIQEFKKGQKNGYPEPQLLAELISAIELNNEKMMRGAYIVGATWNFVILEKVGKNSYQYFVSRDFLSTNIEDLKAIYKNLLFVKQEIIEKIEAGE